MGFRSSVQALLRISQLVHQILFGLLGIVPTNRRVPGEGQSLSRMNGPSCTLVNVVLFSGFSICPSLLFLASHPYPARAVIVNFRKESEIHPTSYGKIPTLAFFSAFSHYRRLSSSLIFILWHGTIYLAGYSSPRPGAGIEPVILDLKGVNSRREYDLHRRNANSSLALRDFFLCPERQR